MGDNPLVSVPVVTYNSSKTVLETLESIKAQTYQNIELIISDDCSTDNTVEICRKWIEGNTHRFVRTVLITSPTNTGISANSNRAEAACSGEWVKGIAGDDLLLPKCIESCVNYVLNKDDVIFLFGRIELFGADKSSCDFAEQRFDYSFFNLSIDQQLHRLIFVGNCIPASTAFYNRLKYASLGISNDERIPLLEDWPKWIKLIKQGVKLHFIDNVLVKYRIGGISTLDTSLAYFRSNRKVFFYYLFPEWCAENQESAITRVIDQECRIYEDYLNINKRLIKITTSFPYRLYQKILYPIKSLYKRCR